MSTVDSLKDNPVFQISHRYTGTNISLQRHLAEIGGQILLVKHFSWIFPFDPNRLGQIIIVIATIVALLPCAAVTIVNIVQGNLTINTVAFLAGMPFSRKGVSVLQAYILFWAVTASLTLVIALAYIPHHLESHFSCQAIQTGECHGQKKEVNLKRILLGLFGVTFHLFLAILGNYTGLYKGVPVNAYSSTTILNMMLVYFILDDSVWACMKINLAKKLPCLKVFIRGTRVEHESYYGQVQTK